MNQQILQLGSEFHLHSQHLLVQVALGVRLTELLCFGIGRSSAVSKANTLTSIQRCGGSGCWGLMDPISPLTSTAHLQCSPCVQPHLTDVGTPSWVLGSPSSPWDFTGAKAMVPA